MKTLDEMTKAELIGDMLRVFDERTCITEELVELIDDAKKAKISDLDDIRKRYADLIPCCL